MPILLENDLIPPLSGKVGCGSSQDGSSWWKIEDSGSYNLEQIWNAEKSRMTRVTPLSKKGGQAALPERLGGQSTNQAWEREGTVTKGVATNAIVSGVHFL